MRQYEWLKEGLLEVVWEGIGDSRERVHSHHLRVDKKMRGFYHGREGQLDVGVVLELGRGGVYQEPRAENLCFVRRQGR